MACGGPAVVSRFYLPLAFLLRSQRVASEAVRRRMPAAVSLPLPCPSRSPRPAFVSSVGGGAGCSFHSLADSVMEELRSIGGRRCARASVKMGLPSSKELVADAVEKGPLRKGLLLEFKKDSENLLLGVAQRPDGKKSWMVYDQNGTVSSIRPQQVTYVVPGIEDFEHTHIPEFIQKAQELLDPAILEVAWTELLEKNKSVTAEELAETIYGSRDPLESYCAHLLLSKEGIYFSVSKIKGFSSVYTPRPAAQVEELLQRKQDKKSSEKDLEEFAHLVLSARSMAADAKPSRCTWLMKENTKHWVESLEAYSIDACRNDEQRRTAGMILKAAGLPRTSSAAMNLLIDIGYFPVHVNLDLLKFNIHTGYDDKLLFAAENIMKVSLDPDEGNRKDLTCLKVYAIDVDEPDELDDALSATKLPDGRIRVWIHVADPSSLVGPRHIIEREAMKRGTSVFLPTITYPMFPEKLAMDAMSLQRGKICKAVSVSVLLHKDGSIAEYTIKNSFIRPTYMLTYESACELLNLNLEEETELGILAEAAALRYQWRLSQGAIDMPTIEPRIKVSSPDEPEPSINLYVKDQSDPAMRLVSEMMILCGEAVATFGCYNNISLPYRGQPQSKISTSTFSHIPEGPARSYAYVKIIRAAEMDFKRPLRHGILGLPGYVQFTSPIRRYSDLLAHYQVKAFLRGECPPFSSGELEGIACLVNMHVRVAKKIQNSSLRYWLLEYLRRQPRERKYRGLVIRFTKDRVASLLLVEVGIKSSARISDGVRIGDEVEVIIDESDPRNDVLAVSEAQ